MNGFDFSAFTDKEFAAYLAGFTDGEGYIGVEPTTRDGIYSVRITLANCVPEVLYGFQARLGFGAIRSQQQKPHWRRKYTLNFGSLTDCERFLIIVAPFLTIKKTVAQGALAYIETTKQKNLKRKARNQAIRDAAAQGEMRKAIAQRFGVSPQGVSRICDGHKWPSEMSRFAKTRKRDARGLFVPISHSAPPS